MVFQVGRKRQEVDPGVHPEEQGDEHGFGEAEQRAAAAAEGKKPRPPRRSWSGRLLMASWRCRTCWRRGFPWRCSWSSSGPSRTSNPPTVATRLSSNQMWMTDGRKGGAVDSALSSFLWRSGGPDSEEGNKSLCVCVCVCVACVCLHQTPVKCLTFTNSSTPPNPLLENVFQLP